MISSCCLYSISVFIQENKFLKFLSFMWNPLSWVMEAAAVMAIVLANGGVSFLRTLNSFSFSFAFTLMKGWTIAAYIAANILIDINRCMTLPIHYCSCLNFNFVLSNN